MGDTPNTVYFRMYQKNRDGREERIYKKYWGQYPVHFVESLSETPKAEGGKEGDAGRRWEEALPQTAENPGISL